MCLNFMQFVENNNKEVCISEGGKNEKKQFILKYLVN